MLVISVVGWVLAHLLVSGLFGYVLYWIVWRPWPLLRILVAAALVAAIWLVVSVVVFTAGMEPVDTYLLWGCLAFLVLFAAWGGGVPLGWFVAHKRRIGRWGEAPPTC